MAAQINSKMHSNASMENSTTSLSNSGGAHHPHHHPSAAALAGTVHQQSNESVDLDNLFAFLSEVTPSPSMSNNAAASAASASNNNVIDDISENLDSLVQDLDVELENVIQQEIDGLTLQSHDMQHPQQQQQHQQHSAALAKPGPPISGVPTLPEPTMPPPPPPVVHNGNGGMSAVGAQPMHPLNGVVPSADLMLMNGCGLPAPGNGPPLPPDAARKSAATAAAVAEEPIYEAVRPREEISAVPEHQDIQPHMPPPSNVGDMRLRPLSPAVQQPSMRSVSPQTRPMPQPPTMQQQQVQQQQQLHMQQLQQQQQHQHLQPQPPQPQPPTQLHPSPLQPPHHPGLMSASIGSGTGSMAMSPSSPKHSRPSSRSSSTGPLGVGHHQFEQREQRRKHRVEKKLQEMQQIDVSEREREALRDDVYHDILEFAENHFNTHERTPEGTIMATLTRKGKKSMDMVPKYEMVTYYRGNSIPSSHIHMYDPENVAFACTIFKDLCRYIRGELNAERELQVIQYVIGQGIEREELRDEIFVQCMRQATNNPHTEWTDRVWLLMCLTIVAFQPSKTLMR